MHNAQRSTHNVQRTTFNAQRSISGIVGVSTGANGGDRLVVFNVPQERRHRSPPNFSALHFSAIPSFAFFHFFRLPPKKSSFLSVSRKKEKKTKKA